ncbi:hypothetical protein, partial [Rhodococcus sp. MALMAid1271]|uniref:hypothetical protein n=1 Tax=Rhodococcus sp. MALMAid1271 TaxID=3411744 RepID=UPI003B9ED179
MNTTYRTWSSAGSTYRQWSFRRLHSCPHGRSAGSTPARMVVPQAPLLPAWSFRRLHSCPHGR